MTRQATVTIGAGGTYWICTVAVTTYELATGLSNVESMLPGVGMLFVLPSDEIVTVNMNSMLFPLDIVFISEDLKVTEIYENVEPLNSFVASLPCRYFLEVNAGEAAGLLVGDDVTIVYADLPVTTSSMSAQEVRAMMVQAATYSAYAAIIGTAMATMGASVAGEAPEAVLTDLRYSFGSKVVDQAIKNVGKDDVVRLAEEIDRLFVLNLRTKYGSYATDAALQAVPPGETKKVEEVARVLAGYNVTYATEAVAPEYVEKVIEKAKKRASIKHPAKPQKDTQTGVMYKSMHAAYVAVASEYGLDPSNHFGIYGLKKQDPNRFKNVSMETYLKYKSKTNL